MKGHLMITAKGTVLCCLLLTLTSLSSTAQPVAPLGWLSNDWFYRVPFSVAPAQIAGSAPLNNFTVLLKIGTAAMPNLYAHAKTDGSDLVLTAADGTSPIPYELVRYDSGLGQAELWFRSDLDPNSSNDFFLYYGNADTTVSYASDVAWGPEHLGVYHFSDDPSLGTLTDAGPANNHGLIGSGSTFDASDLVSAQICEGWRFNGTSDWVYNTTMASNAGSYTISAWFANSPERIDTAMAFQTLTGYWDISFQRTSIDANADLALGSGEIYWQPDVVDNLLHHYAWTLDAVADTAYFYLDGVRRAVKAAYIATPGQPIYEAEDIGGRVGIASPIFGATQDLCDGVVDEYRIIEGARSGEWLLTEYRNQSAHLDFWAFDAEESLGNGVTDVSPLGGHSGMRIAAWPNPFRGRTQIDVESGGGDLRVHVYDVAGRVVRELQPVGDFDQTRRFHWDGRDLNGRAVSSGIYYLRAQDGGGSAGVKVLLRP